MSMSLMRRKNENVTGDLFAAAGVSSEPVAMTVSTPLIDSALVAESAVWLSKRAVTLGNLLASDRAAEYVAILRAFAKLREGHEPEPLHESVLREVCGEDASPDAEQQFKASVRQLKDWKLLTERIEKERLRGYRDKRRDKFRYRLEDDAIAFVGWLEDRHAKDLSPEGADITGNLLDMQCSLLHELRRKLRTVDPEKVDYESAGDILYRVEQLRLYVEATAKTLQVLNLRLLAFGTVFKPDEAKAIVGELGVFLERFGRRFGVLREEIVTDLLELGKASHVGRWTACVERLRTEAARFTHISSVRVPDPFRILADATAFYAPEGSLVSLMSRVTDSARRVWGKLNARLRELERRNHRLEDLGARLKEFALLAEDEVPSNWMRRLLETASLRGDAQISPDGEKAKHPLPKLVERKKRERIVTWITPRKVGEKADVLSIDQARGDRLKEWMKARGISPSANESVRLSAGQYASFDDCRGLVQLIESVRLGNGAKARRYLGVEGRPESAPVEVATPEGALAFEDLILRVYQEKDPK